MPPAKHCRLTPEREKFIKWAATHNPAIILGDFKVAPLSVWVKMDLILFGQEILTNVLFDRSRNLYKNAFILCN
jgi:hypothetical protein